MNEQTERLTETERRQSNRRRNCCRFAESKIAESIISMRASQVSKNLILLLVLDLAFMQIIYDNSLAGPTSVKQDDKKTFHLVYVFE